MRALAPQMPWYLRPPESTGLTLEQFCEYVHAKLVQTLRPQDVPELKRQDVTQRRRLLRHFCFKLLEQSMYGLTHDSTPADVAVGVRNDLTHVTRHGEMVFKSRQHPLYNDPMRAKSVERGGLQVKVMDVNREDRQLAEWLKGPALDQLIAALPGLMRKSPDVRLIQYAVPLRRKLRELIEGFGLQPYAKFSPDERDALLTLIIEEWVTMADQMNVTDRAIAAQNALGLQGVLDDLPAEVGRRVKPETITTRAQEEQYNPLLQQLTLRLALEPNGLDVLEDLATAWIRVQQKLGIAPCDRPSTAVATLAVMTRYEDTAVQGLLTRL